MLALLALLPMRLRVPNDVVRGFLWWLPGCLVFFRSAFTSGFDRLIGDDADTRFIVYIYEHWVQVAKGNASWTSPEFFYPTKGTLAYSDTYLLNEVFYLPLRGLGPTHTSGDISGLLGERLQQE